MAVDTKARSKAFLKSIAYDQYFRDQGLQQQDQAMRMAAESTPESRAAGIREGLGVAADFTPVVGEIKSAKEGYEDYQAGNYGMAALGAAGAIPFIGYGPRAVKGLLRSGGNFANQVATNMPTYIDGFYSGNPIGSFVRDASRELGGAVASRTSATARAFEDIWGTSSRKVEDIMNRGGPAERLRAKGKADEAVGLGEDAEKTAMAIEAQKSAGITPVNERGALAQGFYGLSFLDRAIDPADTARIANGIGNGFRTVADIPDNITDKFTNHLVNGPHVKTGDGRLYEYQIKSLESSRTAGLLEGAGFKGKGSPLTRAFNVGKIKGKKTSPFLEYEKFISNLNKTKKGKGVTPISAIDTVEYTQLATTLDKSTTQAMNNLLTQGFSKAKEMNTSTMLSQLSKARAYQRAGKKIPTQQQKVLDAFNSLTATKSIDLKTIKDEAGNVVSSLDYNKIKKPEGYITAQQSFASQQKELGGVNQMLIVDPYNKVNYSMLSDGHDIFGQNPIGGHPLITAQPIVKQEWGFKGFNKKEHSTMYTRENVAASVQKTEELTGLTAPKSVRNATGKTYAQSARKWTNKVMQEGVDPSVENIRAANRTQNKVTGAKAAGTVALGAGMLTGYNAATADTVEKVDQVTAPAPVIAKPTPPQKKTQQVFGQGDTKTIQRDGKSVANVSRQQLQETGLSLRDYLNTWNKTGDRP